MLKQKRIWVAIYLILLVFSFTIPGLSMAQEAQLFNPPPKIDTGDTAWILISTALVLWVARWWRDLCQSDWRDVPQAFKDIYGHVSLFSEGTLYFRRGDPEGFRERIEELLALYGAHGSVVKAIK